MAALGAVRERPVQKAEAEEMGAPEALAERIFGTRALAVPAEEPALVVVLGLATDGARALGRGMAVDPELAQVGALGPGTERDQALETVRDLGWAVELAQALDLV